MLLPASILLASIAFFLSPPLSAQKAGRQPMALLGPDQGLPSGAIITITQDRDGFLWLGTENGIVRYEGSRHRKWDMDDGLPTSYIHRILADSQGNIWVGTLKGLLRFSRGSFEPARLGNMPPGSISSVCIDGQKRIWVIQSGKAFFQQQGLVFKEMPLEHTAARLNMFCGRISGRIYITSALGIRVYDNLKLIHSWDRSDGLPKDGVSLVAEDGQGRIWAGNGPVLCMKEAGESRFTDFSRLLPATLSPNSLPFTDADGSVWLPTQNGALHLNDLQTDLLDSRRGLPFKWVRTIFRDQEGTLWIVGPALARLKGGGRLWNYSLSSGDSGEVVWSVILDPVTGNPLLGTDDGAARMTSQGLEIISGTQGIRIKDLLVDRFKTLWMVSSIGPAMWLLEGERKAVTAPFGELGKGINTVMEDSRGNVWLGHGRQGLLLWDSNTRQLKQIISPEKVNASALGVFGFREDKAGSIWVGTTSGLFIGDCSGKWKRYTAKDGLPSDTVRGITLMNDGCAWIFYQEPRGLTCLRAGEAGLTVLKEFSEKDGLVSNAVFAAEADDKQQIWITTDRGIYRMNPPLHIGRDEGMINEDCAIGALFVDGSRIWVGTASGLVRYDSLDNEPVLPPAKAHIMSIQYGNLFLEPPFITPPPLKASEASVQFGFALPSYINERSIHFQVRLIGLENNWRSTQSHFVRYPALTGGTYRFEVRAAVEGPFGPASGFSFTVHPFWWKTWWAYLIYVLIILGIVLLTIRWRVSALARSKAELENLVTRRTLELSKRNKELSDALINIKQLSGLLPICAHCKKIRDDQGYWNQLETYISAHTDADFSHGICPSCAAELYPNYYRKEDDESEPSKKATEK